MEGTRCFLPGEVGDQPHPTTRITPFKGRPGSRNAAKTRSGCPGPAAVFARSPARPPCPKGPDGSAPWCLLRPNVEAPVAHGANPMCFVLIFKGLDVIQGWIVRVGRGRFRGAYSPTGRGNPGWGRDRGTDGICHLFRS